MKKKMYILALAAVLASGAMVMSNMPSLTASAGWVSSNVLNSSVLTKTELDKVNWFIDDGISLKDGKIEFAKDTFEEATLLYRTRLYADVDNSTYTIKATLGIRQMAGEKRFGIGFGFGRMEYLVGDQNTNFAYVEKSGDGYVAGVCSYDGNEEKKELVSTPVTLSGTEWKFEIVGSYPNSITVKLDEQTIYEGETATEDISGYFGFMETGDTSDTQYSEGYVTGIAVYNDYYDAPENVNINDDFSDNFLNAGVWHLYNNASYLKGVAVSNGQLRFMDCNQSSVTTKYKYSNFEMTLDIPYVQKTALFNADGSLKTAACNWFGFMCGVQANDYTAVMSADQIRTTYSGYSLVFKSSYDSKGNALGGTSVEFGPMNARKTYSVPSKYDLWDLGNENKTLNVAFTCRDGVFNLDLKWADETEYYHVFTAEYTTATGYISFVSNGNGETYSPVKSNFALDNVKITNRDYKGNVLSGIEKESNNLIKDDADYGYADTKHPAQLIEDGADFDNDGSNGCGGVLDVGTASVAVLAGVAALIKRRNEK